MHTIDVDAPLAERSDRARVDTINLPPVPCATALASLRERGYRLTDAAPDGNCAQRASNRSAGRGPPAAATASDAATLRTLRAQRVRIVGCKSEKPEMVLMGKLRKDLWDDDNVQTPLPLNVKKERGELQQQQAEIAVAASLGGD